jgi:mono/diheme cytochrome c family protein
MKRTAIRAGLCLALGSLMFLVVACSARRSEPLAGPLTLSPQAAQGRLLFMRYCHQCHPGGEAGVGPAINNKPLPAFAIWFQVRHGFGAMPAFDEDEVSAAQLDDLIVYLQALRRHG